MTNVTPLHSQETVVGALRNALMIAQEWGRLDWGSAMTVPNAALKDSIASHEAVARLIRHAIEGLSDPNLAAVQAAATMLREAPENPSSRYSRDTAAAVLRAAVTGEIPPTHLENLWSQP